MKRIVEENFMWRWTWWLKITKLKDCRVYGWCVEVLIIILRMKVEDENEICVMDGLNRGETTLEGVKNNDYGESWCWYCVSHVLSKESGRRDGLCQLCILLDVVLVWWVVCEEKEFREDERKVLMEKNDWRKCYEDGVWKMIEEVRPCLCIVFHFSVCVGLKNKDGKMEMVMWLTLKVTIDGEEVWWWCMHGWFYCVKKMKIMVVM